MKPIDKKKLTDHLKTCIEISKGKNDLKVAEVLQNLNKEIKEGVFDPDDAGGDTVCKVL